MTRELIRRWEFEYASKLTLSLANVPGRVRIPNTGGANPVTMALHRHHVVAQCRPEGFWRSSRIDIAQTFGESFNLRQPHRAGWSWQSVFNGLNSFLDADSCLTFGVSALSKEVHQSDNRCQDNRVENQLQLFHLRG